MFWLLLLLVATKMYMLLNCFLRPPQIATAANRPHALQVDPKVLGNFDQAMAYRNGGIF